MLKQTFLLAALVIFSLLLGCVSTSPLELGEIDSRVQSLEKELQEEREKVKQLTVQLQAREIDPRVRSLEKELREEREKVKHLTVQLQALRLPITGPSVSVTELVFVPEEYLGKHILLEVQLTHLPSIGQNVSYFMVRDLNNDSPNLYCIFYTQELDPDSRRLLASRRLGQRMKISGQLRRVEPLPPGLGWQVDVRPRTGYEFHVSRVIN